MRRFPALAFGLVVAATVGAFFLTLHLRSANPLVWDHPFPIPSAFNPVHGRICKNPQGENLDYRSTFLNFGISHADSVGVYIVKASDAEGAPVATVSSGTEMQTSLPGQKKGTHTFIWSGRRDDGSYAPDGLYYFRVSLRNAGRTVQDFPPVRVLTARPRPRVLSVEQTPSETTTGTGTDATTTESATTTASATTGGLTTSTATQTGGSTTTTTSSGPAVLSPPSGTVTIHYTRGRYGYRRVWINIYRTDVSGTPHRVDRFAEPLGKSTATWDGMIGHKPAPAGTYLVGITVQDVACNQATWPAVMPPTPGTTPGAGVTIRYLSVTPPLTPAASGSRVSVPVVSQAAITYELRRAGTAKVVAHGTGGAGSVQASVRLPKHEAGLYELTVHSAGHTSTVPIAAYATGKAAAHARVLVVLPSLTWLGDNPVDDTGDGLPDTLKSGSAAKLRRPLVGGLPASVADDGALLQYLRSEHFAFQVTTDVALDQGVGPSLVDRWGVLFPDGERYLPGSITEKTGLAYRLKSFVAAGGRVLGLGTGTFKGTSEISGYPGDPVAAAPKTTKADLFGAQRGPLTPTNGELITELEDHLNLLGGAVAFRGFSHYQPVEPPSAEQTHASAAGIGSPAILAYPYGRGTVVEIALPNFGASLANNVDAQELLANIWHKLAKLP